jgi:hypothetical protein
MNNFLRAAAAKVFKLNIPELTDVNRSRVNIVGQGDGEYLCMFSPDLTQETRIYQDGEVIMASDYSDVLGWQNKSNHKAGSESAIEAYKLVGKWFLENNFAVPPKFYFVGDHQNTSGYNTRRLRVMHRNGQGVGTLGY